MRKIKEYYPEIVTDSFHIKSLSLDDLKREVLNLNLNMFSTSRTILVTILTRKKLTFIKNI